MTEGDVSSFKGIPYAAAPVGANRWRPPQPFPAWPGERDASTFGADPPQRGFGPGAAAMSTTSSEDCLFLNVWRPAKATENAKLPVMVWIYGRAFVFGSGSQPGYSGVQFAKQGVILVTFNYRLGRLGFFAHPALSREHPQEPKGNYAYMDQIAALRWVQTNIAALGVSPSLQQRMRYGAAHASEIAYVFDNLSDQNGVTVTPKDKEVAKMMNTYWANFARTGDPNGQGLSQWPVYDPKKNEVFEFRSDGSAVNTPDQRKARLDVMEKAATSTKSN